MFHSGHTIPNIPHIPISRLTLTAGHPGTHSCLGSRSPGTPWFSSPLPHCCHISIVSSSAPCSPIPIPIIISITCLCLGLSRIPSDYSPMADLCLWPTVSSEQKKKKPPSPGPHFLSSGTPLPALGPPPVHLPTKLNTLPEFSPQTQTSPPHMCPVA